MTKNDFVELVLTCGSREEAQRIADVLLEKRLVACVKFEAVHSKYWWEEKLEENDEVKLSMLSIAGNFSTIETEVAKLHSYETFVLQAMPITHLSTQAAKWLAKELDI